jgi:hypothetical protein
MPIVLIYTILVPFIIFTRLKKYKPDRIMTYHYIINWGNLTFEFKKEFFYFMLIKILYKSLIMFGATFSQNPILKISLSLLGVVF